MAKKKSKAATEEKPEEKAKVEEPVETKKSSSSFSSKSTSKSTNEDSSESSESSETINIQMMVKQTYGDNKIIAASIGDPEDVRLLDKDSGIYTTLPVAFSLEEWESAPKYTPDEDTRFSNLLKRARKTRRGHNRLTRNK